MDKNNKVKPAKPRKKPRTEEPPTTNQYHYRMPPPSGQYNYYPPRKLYRSTRDKWLGGVCGGIAEYYNTDPKLVRLLWIVVTIFSVGVGIIAYILFWIFVEKYPSYYLSSTPSSVVHFHYHSNPMQHVEEQI